jgi:hypothetical protein
VALVGAWVSPSFADASRIVNGPYLTGMSPTGIEVRFELDGDSAASVEVRAQAADSGVAGPRFTDAASKTMHVVRVNGLTPGAAYTYDVRVGATVLAGGHFSAGPKPDSSAPATFLVYGDDRTDPVAHAAVVRAMMSTPSDFLVNTGDTVEDGGKASDWHTFFDVEAPLLRDRPLFLAIGNHELYNDAAGSKFARYFGFADGSGGTKPYGTVRVAATRFFFLNGMDDWDSGEERHWLEGELARAEKEAGLHWRIAVAHHGPASSGPHGPNAKLVGAHVPELLSSHGVDLMLAGHDHLYERGEVSGLKYVVSGGGGAPLYRTLQPTSASTKVEAAYHFMEVTPGEDALRTIVHRADGSILERCTMRHGLPWDCSAGTSLAAPAPTQLSAVEAPASPAAPPTTAGKCSCGLVGGGGEGGGWDRGVGGLFLGLAGVGTTLVRRGRRRS